MGHLTTSNLQSMWENKIEQVKPFFNPTEKGFTDFIDIAIHDLDAPLRKLSLLIERLTAGYENITDNAENTEMIKKINSCITDMRALINELSELNEAGPEIQYDHVNISELMKEILEELQPEITEKKVTVQSSALPVLQGSSEQLKKLLKHIIDNAIRFNSGNESPQIKINSSKLGEEEKQFRQLEITKEYYKIEVADNGIGIKEGYEQKIFEPFVRLNSKPAFAGSGLGLAVCKKIIENHGGEIYAESSESFGTQIILILPETAN